LVTFRKTGPKRHHVWGDNIKIDLKETGREDADCIKMTYDRVQLRGAS